MEGGDIYLFVYPRPRRPTDQLFSSANAACKKLSDVTPSSVREDGSELKAKYGYRCPFSDWSDCLQAAHLIPRSAGHVTISNVTRCRAQSDDDRVIEDVDQDSNMILLAVHLHLQLGDGEAAILKASLVGVG